MRKLSSSQHKNSPEHLARAADQLRKRWCSGLFLFVSADTPGPEFRGNLRESGRRSPSQGTQRSDRPLGPDFALAKRESRPFRPDFAPAKCESRPFHPDFSTAKRQSRPFRPEFRAAKRQSRPFHPDFSTAKRQSRPFHPDFCAAKRESRPFHPALGGAAGVFGAKTARFLITREGSKFYETATKGDFFVATSSPLVNLLFCQGRAKLGLRRGKTPPRNPAAPRGLPNDRDRPPAVRKPARAPKPGDPAPACLLEKALWVPPTTDPFRWAPGGKPEKGKRKGRRNPRWHDHPRFAHARSLTTAPPDDGWEGSQPKRT